MTGRHGEPFLRLRTRGRVREPPQPDVAVHARRSRGEDLTGVDADPDAAPDWALVADGPSYAWVDPRALIGEVPEHGR